MDAHHPDLADVHAYAVPINPKMLRETLCVAQSALGELGRQRPAYNAGGMVQRHIDRLSHLIAECDRKRPTGPDGKHDDRHTPECGCGSPSANRPAAQGGRP